MPENRLARNSPCPVLHEIVLVEPLKYFKVVTESYRNEIPLHKNVSYAVCKGDKGTESLNTRTTKKNKSLR